MVKGQAFNGVLESKYNDHGIPYLAAGVHGSLQRDPWVLAMDK